MASFLLMGGLLPAPSQAEGSIAEVKRGIPAPIVKL